jgi:hypothetical protein
MAIKMRIDDPQHAMAWSRAREGRDRIASRLECLAVRITAEPPDWGNLVWREPPAPSPPCSPLAAPQVDTSANALLADAENSEIAGKPPVADPLPEPHGANPIIQQGSMCVLQRQGQPPTVSLVWRRAWFQLAAVDPDSYELRMHRAQPSPEEVPARKIRLYSKEYLTSEKYSLLMKE